MTLFSQPRYALQIKNERFAFVHITRHEMIGQHCASDQGLTQNVTSSIGFFLILIILNLSDFFHQVELLVGLLKFMKKFVVFADKSNSIKRVLDDNLYFFQFKRFRNIVIGPITNCLYSRFQRGKTGDQNDKDSGESSLSDLRTSNPLAPGIMISVMTKSKGCS